MTCVKSVSGRASRSARACLLAAAIAASAPSAASGGPLFGWFEPDVSCSIDPNRGHNASNDLTAGKMAAEVFRDARTAALAEAVARNATREVTALVKHGANPNARGEWGLTMLGWAMRRRSPDAFAALLDAGADATVSEHYPSTAMDRDAGRTVVHYAAMDENPAYLDMLLAHHVSVDVRTNAGDVPLVDAILSACDKHFHRLIAAHANVNAADSSGDTPLHVAAQTNSFERVIDLLNAGADPTMRDRIGNTFQIYLRMTPEKVLNTQARTLLAQTDSWLIQHHVPIERRAR